MTVTKSKPPGLNVGFAALDSLQEGTSIDPGVTQTLHLQFAPQTPGSAADQWVINADGAQGTLTRGSPRAGPGAVDRGELERMQHDGTGGDLAPARAPAHGRRCAGARGER